MQKFKVFVNFKTSPQGTGEKAVELAKICEGFGGDGGFEGIEIIPIVQAVDIFRIKQSVNIPIWAQHLDWQEQGAFTGWQNLEALIEAGASGTLLNHSEHQISPGTAKQTLASIKGKKRFETMICCKTLGQMERLVKLKPNFIGYEVSELIGGKVSITNHNQKAIQRAVKLAKTIPLIIGAGINKAEDLAIAQKLGCAGVLISSAIVLSQDPKQQLEEILKLIISAQEV